MPTHAIKANGVSADSITGNVQIFKTYVAFLSQDVAATDNPTANEMQNDIGVVTWTRVSSGVYRATSAGFFTVGKTFLPNFGTTSDGYGGGMGVYSGGQKPLAFFQANLIDSSTIEFTLWAIGTSNSFVSDIYTQISPGTLPIEIRVYP